MVSHIHKVLINSSKTNRSIILEGKEYLAETFSEQILKEFRYNLGKTFSILWGDDIENISVIFDFESYLVK